MSNGLVSVIIVTAGNRSFLDSCLDSLKVQTYPHFEIIVINNSGKKDSLAALKQRAQSLAVFESPNNLFYAQALDKGITLSKGEFVLCLNDDTVLEKDFIKEALACFSKDKRIGIVSGKIKRFDKKTIDSTGLFLTCFRTVRERGYGARDKGQFEKSGYVFGVTGAVAFYSRKMLEAVKIDGEYFDSSFRIFFEDLDISWRAQRLGWKGWYTPGAVALHLRGGTVRSPHGIDKPGARRFLNDQLHWYLIRNRYLAMAKNESLGGFLLHLPCLLFYEITSWLYIIVCKRGVLSSMRAEPFGLHSALKKRKSQPS